ncbi:MAG: UDP-glucose 4-epimerase [Solirubrobacteraceae bacterium]|jgi:nucleoside-diphosphate-sugar epimerase|nr:UDP-glucose 4-epimerase [Solirubrobacteraceae bacterium]
MGRVTYLVTGATGFLGHALLPRLAERGEVVALHRRASDPPKHRGVRWVPQDLSRMREFELPKRTDVVIHLAQSLRYRDHPQGAVDVFEVNAGATVRLLDHCRRTGGTRFVLASTGAVYAPGPEPAREEDRPHPPNFYAHSKLWAEEAAMHYRDEFDVTVLRPFFIYGPGQQRDRFLPGLVARILDGETIRLAGDDGIRLNPVYIDDAVESVLRALELEGSDTLNLAGPDTRSVREIAERAAEALGREPSFERAPPQHDLIASIERLRERVGAPRVFLSEGIARTIAAW